MDRITEAELRELVLAADYESRNDTRPLDWTAESMKLVTEIRRLRGLIAGNEVAWTGLLDAVAKSPYHPILPVIDLLARLKTEAEAIRAEAGEYWRRCSDCSTEYPCPEPGVTRCPKCGSYFFIADGLLPKA